MMILQSKKRQKAFTLLELMVSVLLFTIVMMSFAMVFPSGLKLNVKTRNRSQAAKTANGIMERLHSLMFSSIGGHPNEPTIQAIAGSPTGWDPNMFENYFEKFIPGYPDDTEFYLPYNGDGELNFDGIQVVYVDATLVMLRVTVAWRETRTGEGGVPELVNRFVTLTSFRSINHN